MALRQRPDTAGVDRTAAVVAGAGAALQLGGVVLLVVLRVTADAEVGDRAGVVALAGVYGVPPMLALLALGGRRRLLLVSGVASMVLAVVPFSVHSFLYGPVGIAYVVAYARRPAQGQRAAWSAAAALVASGALVGALVVLTLHADPLCYAKDASGNITIERGADADPTGEQTIEADSAVVERGCSSDTVVWWESGASLALSAAAMAAALALVSPDTREDADAAES